MINYRKGDLFSKYTIPAIIVHGGNAQGVMGSGFAAQIKKRFPEAYCDYINQKEYTLGSVIMTQYWPYDLTICTIISQEYYGRDKSRVYVDYDALYKGLRTVANIACNTPIYMPLIGGGLANGDRDKLISIYEKALLNATAFLYELD